jgi:hypothetical protein
MQKNPSLLKYRRPDTAGYASAFKGGAKKNMPKLMQADIWVDNTEKLLKMGIV